MTSISSRRLRWIWAATPLLAFAASANASFSVSTATVSPSSVVRGGTETISVSVISTLAASNQIVDLEVYNSAGAKVGQKIFTGQSFTAGVRKPYSWSWIVPSTEATGAHVVKVGVFTSAWAMKYWNNGAATFSVTTTATTATPKPTAAPTPTPTPVATPKPTATPVVTPAPTPTPVATPAPTATPSPTVTPIFGSLVPLNPPDASQGWLATKGNRIYRGSSVWVGRGLNAPDTRKCWGTTNPLDEYLTAAQANVIMDVATDSYQSCSQGMQTGWGADFIRIPMGAYVNDSGNFIEDANYRNNTVAIVNHLATKRVGANHDRPVYVELSLWNDPSMNADEVPTTSVTGPRGGSKYTVEQVWTAIATVFYKYPYVMFGITNEPNNVLDEAAAWSRFNEVVQAIRKTEDRLAAQLGQATPYRHIIAVQGLNSWARKMDYFITHPITAGGGANVVYETHAYDPADGSDGFGFTRTFIDPSKTLPVIIGEFGPDGTYMKQSDLQPMMTAAEQNQVPYMGWYLQDSSCGPAMLASETLGSISGRACIDLSPTAWGTTLKSQLAKPSP